MEENNIRDILEENKKTLCLSKGRSPFRFDTENLGGIKRKFRLLKNYMKRGIASAKEKTNYMNMGVVHFSEKGDFYLTSALVDNYSAYYMANKYYAKSYDSNNAIEIVYPDGMREIGLFCTDFSDSNIKPTITHKKEIIDDYDGNLARKRLVKDWTTKGILQMSKDQTAQLRMIAIVCLLGGLGIGFGICWTLTNVI